MKQFISRLLKIYIGKHLFWLFATKKGLFLIYLLLQKYIDIQNNGLRF